MFVSALFLCVSRVIFLFVLFFMLCVFFMMIGSVEHSRNVRDHYTLKFVDLASRVELLTSGN